MLSLNLSSFLGPLSWDIKNTKTIKALELHYGHGEHLWAELTS